MKKIFVRSPYIIEVEEIDQTASKIELFLYKKSESIPTNATYILSKDIVSTSQVKNSYNISNFIKENINIVYPSSFSTIPSIEDENVWCYCLVKRYAYILGVETYLDSETFVCFNGYNNYSGGVNKNVIDDIVLLRGETTIKVSDLSENKFVNIWLPIGDYTWQNGNGNFDFSVVSENLYRLPLYYMSIGNNRFVYDLDHPKYIYIYMDFDCEPKYTPILCSFTNRFGGWEHLTFFKAKSESIDVENQTYQFLPSQINYNPLEGQSKSFGFIGKRAIKVNTGWVKENIFELIQDLLLSENVSLDGVPVIVKTKQLQYKTHLKDKNINYEIEFDYAFDLINNVI